MEKIDIVYTWVEETPEFTEEKRDWYNKYFTSEEDHESNSSKNRFSDHEEIKYSLRSLDQYFPYYRNIYIVVKDGQWPKYLRKDHPRLKIINHSQIIPNEYLPTFNAFVIEQYIHKIPGLSEYYIYFNDDILILNKIDPSYYLTHDGKIYGPCGTKMKVRNYTIDENYNFYTGWNINNVLLDELGCYEKKRYHIQHVPKMYKKSYSEEIEKRLKQYYYVDQLEKNIFDLSASYKFRNNRNLYLNVLINYYLYKYWFGNNKRKNYAELFLAVSKYSDFNQILTSNNKFLCLNDILNYKETAEVIKKIGELHKVLELKYPNKSQYEI